MASHLSTSRGAVLDPDTSLDTHPDSAEIAAYLDDGLEPTEKERLQAHLAECAECRAEMVELVELMEVHERGGGSGRRPWVVPAALAAAAAAAVLLVAIPVARDGAEQPDALRAPGAATEREAIRAIAATTPVADRPVDRAGLVFAWRAVGEDASYRVTVTDSAGIPVWVAETADTRIAPPEGVGLEPGGEYLWYVDAVLADGTTATSGVRSLILAP